jgi:hypothetical protein
MNFNISERTVMTDDWSSITHIMITSVILPIIHVYMLFNIPDLPRLLRSLRNGNGLTRTNG